MIPSNRPGWGWTISSSSQAVYELCPLALPGKFTMGLAGGPANYHAPGWRASSLPRTWLMGSSITTRLAGRRHRKCSRCWLRWFLCALSRCLASVAGNVSGYFNVFCVLYLHDLTLRCHVVCGACLCSWTSAAADKVEPLDTWSRRDVPAQHHTNR